MELLIIFFLLSIVFSFLCSVWEAVLLSINPSYINAKIEEQPSIGNTLKVYKDDIDKPLSAILTLNTIAHTVGAIGVGAQASKVFTNNPDLPFGLSYESLIAGLMTLAILVLSEIIPKTIGANNWKKLAPFTVRSLSILMKILAPFVWLSQLITKSLKADKDASVLSRADIRAMANVGMESGVLAENESKIISNLLGLNKLSIKDIMTPRIVMVSADEATPIREYYENEITQRFSRIPVFSESPDHITGVVLKGEALSNIIESKGDKPLSSIKRPVKIMDQDASLTVLFKEFTDNAEHIAIVVDSYGSVTGLVTMEDLVETLIGIEIVDEFDGVEDMQEYARTLWKKRREKSGR